MEDLYVTAQQTQIKQKRLPAANKRVNFQGVPYAVPNAAPTSVARRNARERNRVKQVNLGFATLRSHLPPSICATNQPNNSGTKNRNKASKVDTLKSAVAYIRSLEKLLMEAEVQDGVSTSGSTVSSSGSPSFSEASSPAPSFNGSEHSFFTNSSLEAYDIYDPANIPEVPSEDELLDAIAWWQDAN